MALEIFRVERTVQSAVWKSVVVPTDISGELDTSRPMQRCCSPVIAQKRAYANRMLCVLALFS